MSYSSDIAYQTKQNIPYLDAHATNSNGAPILILHGLFGGLSNFEEVIRKLSTNYRVIMPFFPLFSRDGFQCINQLTKQTKLFLDHISVNEPVHIIGNSLGGQLALNFQLNYPDSVKSLILTGSAGVDEHKFGISTPKRRNKTYIKERTNEVFHRLELDDVYIDEIFAVLSKNESLYRLLKLARNSKQTVLTPRLKQVQCRTLLIWGENDQITSPETAKVFLSHLPQSQIVWIPECGHAPMMEHPEIFYKHTYSFLELFKTQTLTKYQYVSTNYTL